MTKLLKAFCAMIEAREHLNDTPEQLREHLATLTESEKEKLFARMFNEYHKQQANIKY